MIKLQFMSDLHLEVGNQYESFDVPVCAPYLILAGDIGKLENYQSYLGFLERQCRNFERVFLVLGNHEFYGLSWDTALERAKELCNEPCLNDRLILLNRNAFQLSDDVTLLGCTLWSKINSESELSVRTRVKDFARIVDWTTQRHNEEHDLDVAWLTRELQMLNTNVATEGSQARKKIAVVTHHAPIREGSSRPEHLQNPWTDAFATELLQEDSTFSSNVLASVNCWIFGHTHYTNECQRGRVRVVSNQRGYVLPSPPEAKNNELEQEKIPKEANKIQTTSKMSFSEMVGKLPRWLKHKGIIRHDRITGSSSAEQLKVMGEHEFDAQRTIVL